MTDQPTSGRLGTFRDVVALIAALEELRTARFEVADIYMPIPNEEALALAKPGRSPVRFFTFVGGLVGLVSGLSLALWSSGVWGLTVDGKPVYGLVPFMVVGFEFTVLCGALATFLALLWFGRLPFWSFPASTYRARFSEDQFGVVVRCPPSQDGELTDLLRRAGAIAVEGLGSVEELP